MMYNHYTGTKVLFIVSYTLRFPPHYWHTSKLQLLSSWTAVFACFHYQLPRLWGLKSVFFRMLNKLLFSIHKKNGKIGFAPFLLFSS